MFQSEMNIAFLLEKCQGCKWCLNSEFTSRKVFDIQGLLGYRSSVFLFPASLFFAFSGLGRGFGRFSGARDSLGLGFDGRGFSGFGGREEAALGGGALGLIGPLTPVRLR
jgi:hypothetical protein